MIDNREKIEKKLDGYSDIIKSRYITQFFYQHHTTQFECFRIKDELYVKSTGGNKIDRDKTAFRLEYPTVDHSLLNLLQRIIEKYQISYNNGYTLKILGLPDEEKDTIFVTYDDGEQIYKTSNQFQTISNNALEEIYNIFHEDALNNGYDFNYKKSNVPIYDDATKEYLQGKWEGYHSGNKYNVIFAGDNVKILCNNVLQDDCNYIIIRGMVRRNIKKKEIPESEYDFEEFNALSYFKKKNGFILDASFDGYIEEFKRVIEKDKLPI